MSTTTPNDSISEEEKKKKEAEERFEEQASYGNKSKKSFEEASKGKFRPKLGEGIKEAEGPLDSINLLKDAFTGGGVFKGRGDSFSERIAIAFSKSDNITKILSGAGLMAALVGVIDSLSDDDEDDDSNKGLKSIRKSKNKLSAKLQRNKQESDTLASRINSAMQQQNVANNTAGSNMAMRSLASIAIKTQESLISISDFIQESNLALVKSIGTLKDKIDDIESNSGDIFKGLFPILIGGIMVAFGTFFLGGNGENGIIGTIVDSFIDKIKKELGVADNKENLFDGILKWLGLENVKEKLTGTINDIISGLKEINIPESISSVKELLGVLTDDQNGLRKFFSNIGNIESSVKSIEGSLKFFSDTLKKVLPLISSYDTDKDVEEKSWLDDTKNKFIDLAAPIAKKLFTNVGKRAKNLNEISEALNEFRNLIEPLSKLANKLINKEERNAFIGELTSEITNKIVTEFNSIVDKIVNKVTDSISLMFERIDKEIEKRPFVSKTLNFLLNNEKVTKPLIEEVFTSFTNELKIKNQERKKEIVQKKDNETKAENVSVVTTSSASEVTITPAATSFLETNNNKASALDYSTIGLHGEGFSNIEKLINSRCNEIVNLVSTSGFSVIRNIQNLAQVTTSISGINTASSQVNNVDSSQKTITDLSTYA